MKSAKGSAAAHGFEEFSHLDDDTLAAAMLKHANGPAVSELGPPRYDVNITCINIAAEYGLICQLCKTHFEFEWNEHGHQKNNPVWVSHALFGERRPDGPFSHEHAPHHVLLCGGCSVVAQRYISSDYLRRDDRTRKEVQIGAIARLKEILMEEADKRLSIKSRNSSKTKRRRRALL